MSRLVQAMQLATTTEFNVAVGSGALSRVAVSSGGNVAIGFEAMHTATGYYNTGVGYRALEVCSGGDYNVAIGGLISGVGGHSVLGSLTLGNLNVAVGNDALGSITSGSSNVAVGTSAGTDLTVGDSNNVMISNRGVAGDGHITRIGTSQLKCWISGIRGITTGVNDAVAVLVDSTGQLGTTSSSLRYKENIADMGDDSSDIYKLRPVSFTWKDRQSSAKSYGLIAEEVAEAFPYLAVINKEGEPETVKYHELPSLLLNEIKKLNRRIEVLEAKIAEGRPQ